MNTMLFHHSVADIKWHRSVS